MRCCLLLAALLVAACDTEAPPGVEFGGVALEARGDASLAVEGGRLIVSGLDGTRAGGFTVPGRPSRVDVEITPLALAAGNEFGARVDDASGAELASLMTKASAQGQLDFQFAFPGLPDFEAVLIRYFLGGRVVFEGVLNQGNSRRARVVGSGGKGSGEPGSTHVVRERGRYIVVADSDSEGGRLPGGCAGFSLIPPHPFDIEYPNPICTDWVEIEPLVEAPMPEGAVSVTARGVGQFVVEELAVR